MLKYQHQNSKLVGFHKPQQTKEQVEQEERVQGIVIDFSHQQFTVIYLINFLNLKLKIHHLIKLFFK